MVVFVISDFREFLNKIGCDAGFWSPKKKKKKMDGLVLPVINLVEMVCAKMQVVAKLLKI